VHRPTQGLVTVLRQGVTTHIPVIQCLFHKWLEAWACMKVTGEILSLTKNEKSEKSSSFFLFPGRNLILCRFYFSDLLLLSFMPLISLPDLIWNQTFCLSSSFAARESNASLSCVTHAAGERKGQKKTVHCPSPIRSQNSGFISHSWPCVTQFRCFDLCLLVVVIVVSAD
jgi:hypothetical protein